MLSLGKVAPGQQAYYLETVARGAEEYYSNAKEAPGRWMGAGSALLGLSGEVDADELHRVLEHGDPRTGTRLTRAQGAPKVAGFDATFCAPKSVSLLFALGDATTSAATSDAHDAAVDAALSVLEVEAARVAKDPEVVPEALLPEWRERAAAFGLDDEALVALLDCNVDSARVPLPGDDATEAMFADLAGPAGLTAQASSFGRRDVIQAICAGLPNGGDVDDIVALADGFLASEHAVALGQPSHRQGLDVIRRLDGTAVPAHIEDARFTTPELLATERRLIDTALRRRHGGYGLAAPGAVDAAVGARPTLSPEQAAMVRRLTTSGAGVEVVEGVAGSGKTFALGTAREAWEASGCPVIGAALAARAAAELQAGSGIRSSTLDRLLADLDRPDSGGLPVRAVIVVDESAMVGTRKLTRLLDRAHGAGAKVVLVGDRHQLPAIDAGGAFAGLAKRLGAISLTENRRQVEAWERQALTDLRAGNVAAALDAYQAHDLVHQGDTAADVKERLVADWWAARQAGGRQLMIATRHTDVDDLNRRARACLQQAGQLGADQIRIGTRHFATSDEVLATRNDYRLGLINGTRATITHVDQVRSAIAVRTDDGRAVVVPHAYIAAGHITHGYATILHKAQGATLRQAFCSPTTRSPTSAATRASAGARNATTSTPWPPTMDAATSATPVNPNPTLPASSQHGSTGPKPTP